MGLTGIVNWIGVKFQRNPKSIKQLMLPITIKSWLIGRGIVEFPLGEPWPMTSCIYSVFLIMGFCFTSKVALDNFDTIVLTKSVVGSSLLIISIYANTCVVICNTFNGWKSMGAMKTIINRLDVSGKRMEKFGIPDDYRCIYWRQTILVIAEILYVIYIAMISRSISFATESLWLEVNLIVVFYYPLIVLTIGDTAFIILVRSLSLRFRKLNEMLKKMSTATDDSPQHKRVFEKTILNRHKGDVFEKRTNDDATMMRTALKNHFELVTIGYLINETFATQALLSVVFAFYILIAVLHRASTLLLWSTLNENIVATEVGSLLSYMIFISYKIISVASACAQVASECKETAVVISQLHEPLTRKAFRDEISDFLLQMAQYTVKFSACGLFTLDHRLIHGMIGSISTYFIILLQIGDTSSISKLPATHKTLDIYSLHARSPTMLNPRKFRNYLNFRESELLIRVRSAVISSPKSMKQLMLPMTILGWLIGRGVVELPLGKPWPVASFTYSFLLTLSYCFTGKVTLDNDEVVLQSESTVGSSILFAVIVFNVCVVIWNTTNGWKSMKGVKMIIDGFESSGRKLEKMRICQDYRFIYRRQVITVIGEILYLIYVTTASDNIPLDADSLWLKVVVILAFHYPLIVLTIGDMAFITLVRSLNLRFEQLNEMLKTMSTTSDNSPQHKRVLERTIWNGPSVVEEHEKRTNEDANTMRIALEGHYELVTIGNLINDTFATQALLSITFAFYLLIGFLHRITGLLLWPTAKDTSIGPEIMTLFSSVIFVVYKIITMCSACAKVADESEETAVIICQLHEPSTSKAFRNEINDFSLQMTQHTVKFTAWGLFSVDHSLIQGMIGTIATYLIILVQFGDTSTPHSPATSETLPTRAQ
ncbi:uncharacterized protein [Venturia canescens]|uniref:uncharacterized protein n=1 Tax=Venturia canescens TaxID=32260 RepID=UPI001C9C5078|nr:uncharacterized protein LOC122419111 [Venturia canescens]